LAINCPHSQRVSTRFDEGPGAGLVIIAFKS
jgi:hypothetical protein